MISPARDAAFDILGRVEVEGRHADDLLHGAALQNISPRDRALATTLVMGTLRWQLALDAAIAPLLRAGTRLAPEVAIALRLGLYQLWYLDRIPAHAALSESVELAKANGFAGMAGLVNAILRKLQSQTAPEFSRAAVLAHPAWMVERWRAIYGADRTRQICEADQNIPTASIRIGPSQPDVGTAPAALLTRAAVLNGEHNSVATGARIQDEGSQLVAEIAAAAALNATRVLDACAAPGGKTAILAERLPSAQIVAMDISAARLKLMRRLMPAEFSSRIEFVQADASQLPEAAPFDLVLCDVPCSGTGTLARNPEIRLRLSREMLLQFPQRQLQIVESCWHKLRPGGTLAYSTCSLEPEENAQVIERFQKTNRDATIVPARDLVDAMEAAATLTRDGSEMLRASALDGEFLRTLPGVHPCDGFFVAVLRKHSA